jgi:hypothetical protein
MSEYEKNHRDFFRVNCPVLLDYVTVPGQQNTPASSYFPENENFSLLRELKRIDYDNNHLLHNINEQQRDVGAYLTLINKKLELIARNLTSSSELKPQLASAANYPAAFLYRDRSLRPGDSL